MAQIRAFLRNESGATAIEYALIAADISIVIVAAVQAMGSSLNTTFSNVLSSLK
jgi:pilus assembly protein Flp/PilA